MGRPQLHVLDEMISKVRAGRIGRRTFLEGALALGLSSTMARQSKPADAIGALDADLRSIVSSA